MSKIFYQVIFQMTSVHLYGDIRENESAHTCGIFIRVNPREYIKSVIPLILLPLHAK